MLDPVSFYLGPLQGANPFSTPSYTGLANVETSGHGSGEPRLAAFPTVLQFCNLPQCDTVTIWLILSIVSQVNDDAIDANQLPTELPWHLDIRQFNPQGADFFTDAWFGQQLLNLDCMGFSTPLE